MPTCGYYIMRDYKLPNKPNWYYF